MSDAPNLGNLPQSLHTQAQDNISQSNFDNIKLIYLLYFAGFFVGLTSLAGVILAYLKRDGADALSKTHYAYQIRTFWIGFAYIVVGSMLAIVIVGWFVLLWWVVWALVRNLKGFTLLNEGKPIPDPYTWRW